MRALAGAAIVITAALLGVLADPSRSTAGLLVAMGIFGLLILVDES